jgi:hypothetical protein
MKAKLIIWILVCVSFSSLSSPQSGPKTNIRLRLSAAEDGRADQFPLSAYYAGTLFNDSAETVAIDAVQMPGGYLGSGRFFPCMVQVWNVQKKRWDTPHPVKLSNYAGQAMTVRIRPGENFEVCKNLLPQQGGHVGNSVRFALSRSWGHAPSIFSNTFRLGNPVRPGDHRETRGHP